MFFLVVENPKFSKLDECPHYAIPGVDFTKHLATYESSQVKIVHRPRCELRRIMRRKSRCDASQRLVKSTTDHSKLSDLRLNDLDL